MVVWQNLDRLLMGEVDYEKSLGRKMDEVRQHLELVFHRYLSGESGIKKLCYRNINWITGACYRANIGEVKSLVCIKKERVLYKGIYSNEVVRSDSRNLSKAGHRLRFYGFNSR